jgi:predicted transcriptional regulator
MNNKVLSCMYDFVREYPDSPLSVALIARSSDCTEKEVTQLFRYLRSAGMLRKKHLLSHVYTLTPDGFRVVKEGWEDYNRFNNSGREDDSQRSMAS